MRYVAVLSGNVLAAELCEALRAALQGGPLVWLAQGRAAEFTTAQASLPAAWRARLDAAQVDACVLAAEGRRKKLLLADMDSTMIACECIDEIADFAGVKDQVAAITERAMRGELEFEAALRARVALLKGLPETALQRVFDERVRLNPGARTLVRTMAAHGALTALVSGGFTFFTARVAEAAGFDRHFGNALPAQNGVLTGGVNDPILGRAAKLETLKTLAAAQGLALSDTLALGDGANDLGMIEAAGLGIAYHAKPVVAAAAQARIAHTDLTTVLFYQGYAEREFRA